MTLGLYRRWGTSKRQFTLFLTMSPIIGFVEAIAVKLLRAFFSSNVCRDKIFKHVTRKMPCIFITEP